MSGSNFEKLKEKNPELEILSIEDPAFSEYGVVFNSSAASEMIELCGQITEIPETGVSYTADVPALDAVSYADTLCSYFGGQDIQCGVCCGHNSLLNGLEFHKSSEINIAVTDMVLLLAKMQELEPGHRLDSGKVKAFYMKAGDMVEVYATSLHYCPCSVDDYFISIVVLPEATNTPLTIEGGTSESDPFKDLLFANNKWLIAHEQNSSLTAKGVKPGIYNKNIRIEMI